MNDDGIPIDEAEIQIGEDGPVIPFRKFLGSIESSPTQGGVLVFCFDDGSTLRKRMDEVTIRRSGSR